MNLGLMKEEALFIRDLILFEKAKLGEEKLKKIYGDIDIEGILNQLDIIIMLSNSVEDLKI